MKKAVASRSALSRGERGAASRGWVQPLNRPDPVAWERTAITLRHQVKAGALALYCVRSLQLLGCPRDALDYYWPALLHLEGLVYVGDFAVEREQAEGIPATLAWRGGIEEFLRAYGVRDSRVHSELDALERYAQWECEAVSARIPRGLEESIHACYARSSDVRLLTGFSQLLAAVPDPGRADDLAAHMHALGELANDVHTYEKDVAGNSFNLYRMCVWSVGRESAQVRLGEVWAGLCENLRKDVARADHRALVRFARVHLLRAHPLRRLAVKRRPTRVFVLLPRPVLWRYVLWRLRRSARLSLPAVPDAIAEP